MEQKEISKESAVSSATAHNHTHEYTNNSQISNDTDTHTQKGFGLKNWIGKDINILSFHYFPQTEKNPPLAVDITDHL